MPTFSFLQPAVWFCPITEGRRLKMNTSGWGLREDNVCRDSSDRYWPKGRKADGISLTYGKLHSVTQPDQCPLSLSLFSSVCISGGLLMLKLALVGIARAVEHLKMLTDVWENVLRLLRIVGYTVWSARLKDGKPRFQLLLYIPPLTSEGM